MGFTVFVMASPVRASKPRLVIPNQLSVNAAKAAGELVGKLRAYQAPYQSVDPGKENYRLHV